MYRLIDITVLIGLHIIGGVTIAEPVHINLVHHSTLCPVRCLESGNNYKIVILRRFSHRTSHIKKTGQTAVHNFKIIADLLIIQLKLIGIIVELIPCFHPGHREPLALDHQKHLIHIVFCRTKTNGHLFIATRLRGNHIIPGGVTKQCSPVKYRSHFSYISSIVFRSVQTVKIHILSLYPKNCIYFTIIL